jgi:hypothetical protein
MAYTTITFFKANYPSIQPQSSSTPPIVVKTAYKCQVMSFLPVTTFLPLPFFGYFTAVICVFTTTAATTKIILN